MSVATRRKQAGAKAAAASPSSPILTPADSGARVRTAAQAAEEAREAKQKQSSKANKRKQQEDAMGAANGSAQKKKKKAAEEAAAAESVAQPQDDMEALVDLESRILSSGKGGVAQHFNDLVKMLHIAEKGAVGSAVSELAAEELAVRVSAVQACVRVFTDWMASGQFVHSKAAAKKKDKGTAMQTLQGLLTQQYKKLWSLLFSLLQSDVDAVQSNALHAAMDLVQAEGSSAAAVASNPAASVPESLLNGSFAAVLRCIMLSNSVSEATRQEFYSTFIAAHADLRANVYQQLKSLAHMAQADWNAQCKEWSNGGTQAGVHHIVSFLLQSDWQAELSHNWIMLPETDPDEEDLFALPVSSGTLSPAALQKLFGETWLGVLKHKMPADLYKDILVHLHAKIIPAMPQPLLLADFLTDSYNIGGVVSLLALNGLFILISKFNLDYPSFFQKLYACCQPYVFHAKYRARFFQLVSLFLTSSYLPSALVCAFVKRFARLSLTAPPAGCIFCIAVVYNLLRRHPVCRPLINRALKTAPNAGQAQPQKKGETLAVTERIAGPMPTVGAGILSSLAALQTERQKAVASGELTAESSLESLDNQALRLSLPSYKPAPPQHSLVDGNDPYRFEESDPELSQAQHSSLWEIKTLTFHFAPTVANLAKVFFATNAPKRDLEMNKYIEQSYDTLFAKETGRRVNQKVALQQQYKFSGLFADSTQSIGLTFQLPEQAAMEETPMAGRQAQAESDMEDDDDYD